MTSPSGHITQSGRDVAPPCGEFNEVEENIMIPTPSGYPSVSEIWAVRTA